MNQTSDKQMAALFTDSEKAELNVLYNTSINSYSWDACTVEVKDRATGNARLLLENVSGTAKAGEVLALMGPSGSGKTTLLNVLARRTVANNAKVSGDILVDDHTVSRAAFRSIASYVEQEDALIGSLTARETVEIAAHLSRPRSSKAQRQALTAYLLTAFGLNSCSDTLIGTPIRKGISGGQKRRVSVASQLVTGPKILFLDEPTSGLDSTASREVMSFIRKIAKELGLIVIASIHQPSTDTFRLFDKLALLSAGKLCYFGQVDQVSAYFESIAHPIPSGTNPAEYLLDLVNDDFDGADSVSAVQDAWASGNHMPALEQPTTSNEQVIQEVKKSSAIDNIMVLIPLLRRSIMKSYRDVLAYGVRYAMYIGLAIMMGTVWLRLKTDQEYIQSFTNAIFFGSAFMSFMAVAYVPAFLEDRAVYVKDRANGLYGPTAFMLSNIIVGLPYLFGISVLFSTIAYWLSNFRPEARAFLTWIMWLFLDLVAAESLVVFVSSLIPNFVISLALVAFANGLWMSVGGFLHPIPLLNVFWKYVFHFIDYQAYVFQGMMVNEFKSRIYNCAADCQCSYPTGGLKCQIPGTAVLSGYGISSNKEGKWVAILIGITAVYRLLGLAALYWRKS